MENGLHRALPNDAVADFRRDLLDQAGEEGAGLDLQVTDNGDGTSDVSWHVLAAGTDTHAMAGSNTAASTAPVAQPGEGHPCIANAPQTWLHQSVPNGECVAYVRVASGAPATAGWRRGAKVKGNETLSHGTAIATFDQNGTYGDHTDGRSHAAIYDGQDATGLWVYDQWCHPTVQPVHRRPLHFGHGTPVNDGEHFYVILA